MIGHLKSNAVVISLELYEVSGFSLWYLQINAKNIILLSYVSSGVITSYLMTMIYGVTSITTVFQEPQCAQFRRVFSPTPIV